MSSLRYDPDPTTSSRPSGDDDSPSCLAQVLRKGDCDNVLEQTSGPDVHHALLHLLHIVSEPVHLIMDSRDRVPTVDISLEYFDILGGSPWSQLEFAITSFMIYAR